MSFIKKFHLYVIGNHIYMWADKKYIQNQRINEGDSQQVFKRKLILMTRELSFIEISTYAAI